MIDHKVRRLPVIDGRQLVGIISQADIATNVDEEQRRRPRRGDLRRTLTPTREDDSMAEPVPAGSDVSAGTYSAPAAATT